jgi:hypothetical protein
LNKEHAASMSTARLLVLLLGPMLLASCYNPQIVDGGLKCSANFECPSGFKCNQTDGVCYRQGTIPPAGGTGGNVAGTGGNAGTGGATGGAGGQGGSDMCTMPTGQYGPLPNCTPPSGSTKACDEVCQTGCACNERCKLEAGNAVCRIEGPTFLQNYESCDPKSDTCRPGTICLQESPDHLACGSHCYRHCRNDADCPNAKCSIEVQFGTSMTTNKVCSPPMDACNPFGAARCTAQMGRMYPTFGCYVMSSTYPDIAICDCAGTTMTGQACTYEHECEPGSECVLLGAARLCRRVCRVNAAAGTLPAQGGCPPLTPLCTPFPGGSNFGYCH